jgi:hypothetical protein
MTAELTAVFRTVPEGHIVFDEAKGQVEEEMPGIDSFGARGIALMPGAQ